MENEITTIQETKKLRGHSIGRALHKGIEIIQNSIGGSCNDPGAKLLEERGRLIRFL